MKSIQYTLFLIGLIFFQASYAQITITNNTFPSIGDTLKLVSGNSFNNLSMTDSGVDQSWDYSNLSTDFQRQSIYVASSEGQNFGNFPNATMMQSSAQGEVYFDKSESSLNLLGFAGLDPAGFGVSLVNHFSPALIEARAPLTFLDLHTYSSSSTIPFAADELPGGLLDSLPVSPDSLRIRVNIDRTDLVDAWGTIKIPGGEFEVIRQKRIEITESRLDIKISVFPWVDVTDQLGDFGFGLDTLTTYTFLSNDSKEAIASFQYSGEESLPETYELKDLGVITSIQSPSNLNSDIFAYPNPAINDVKFEFADLKRGNYTLKIFNILGLEAFSEAYFIEGSKAIKLDVSMLKKGTYLYSLINEDGNAISTKRLIIIKP